MKKSDLALQMQAHAVFAGLASQLEAAGISTKIMMHLAALSIYLEARSREVSVATVLAEVNAIAEELPKPTT